MARNCNWFEILHRIVLEIFHTSKIEPLPHSKSLEECKKPNSELIAKMHSEFLLKYIDLSEKVAEQELKKQVAIEQTIIEQSRAPILRKKNKLSSTNETEKKGSAQAQREEPFREKQKVKETEGKKVGNGQKESKQTEKKESIEEEEEGNTQVQKGTKEIERNKVEQKPIFVEKDLSKDENDRNGEKEENKENGKKPNYWFTSDLSALTKGEIVERIKKHCGITEERVLEYAVGVSASELLPASHLIDPEKTEEPMIATFRHYGPLAIVTLALMYKIIFLGAINLVIGSSPARLFEPILLMLNVTPFYHHFSLFLIFRFLALALAGDVCGRREYRPVHIRVPGRVQGEDRGERGARADPNSAGQL